MAILGTFNGLNIVSLPCDTIPGVTAPSSIEWDPQEMVSVGPASLTGQRQTYDWQSSWWEAHVSFPPMTRLAADAWSAFILQCRGQSNAFCLGDPKASQPKGSPSGAPVVAGAAQTGYYLVTRGWTPSKYRLLLPGDFIQIGYRFYKVLDQVNSDVSGDATIAIWPPLRDLPADGVAIQCQNCKGLFTLNANSGNKWSTNAGNYGLAGFAIREAF
jgi:hypothetical protein